MLHLHERRGGGEGATGQVGERRTLSEGAARPSGSRPLTGPKVVPHLQRGGGGLGGGEVGTGWRGNRPCGADGCSQ